MKKYIVVLAVAWVFVVSFLGRVSASDLVWEDIARGNMNVRTVLVGSDNSNIIYIGSEQGIFKSEDGGESWRNILSIKGQNKVVNFLLFEPKDKNSLYAVTGNGLFYSFDQGKNWNRLFKGKNYLENECTTLAILPSAIYLGTKAGLFVSSDKGRSWHGQSGEIGKTSILAIACNLKEPNSIYVACVDGVFKTKDGAQSWKRIFTTHPAENENGNETEEITEDQDEEEKSSNLRYITIDPNNLNYLYLATSRGVYKSQDRGETWESVSSYGLLSQDARFLLVSNKSNLYAATKSGVFEYRNDRWQELSLGLMAEDIRFLTQDNQDNLYAACDKGLFKAKIESSDNKRQDEPISLYSKDEPGIKEVQQAAIKYAEVEPEKIERWREQAARRALLPHLTVSMDKDNNRTSSSSIWGIYGNGTTPGRYFVGPDDETRYKNNNWGVSLTWELGDLIFSDDQTNIDVRSRLMVELRDDILDEVTKLYFERIRTKMELDNLSIEDRKKRFDKELKLQELTASIDALTGGYFSRQIKENTDNRKNSS
ncbi:MAG: hypothetical protein NTW64_01275 [Candidatus Omnitrophica bacterium]|nr:hypothetical protein [Candidatus Omnitrophota bacterium]